MSAYVGMYWQNENTDNDWYLELQLQSQVTTKALPQPRWLVIYFAVCHLTTVGHFKN